MGASFFRFRPGFRFRAGRPSAASPSQQNAMQIPCPAAEKPRSGPASGVLLSSTHERERQERSDGAGANARGPPPMERGGTRIVREKIALEDGFHDRFRSAGRAARRAGLPRRLRPRARPRAGRANTRTRAASSRRCTAASSGRCVSSPGSEPPGRPTNDSITCSITARRAFRRLSSADALRLRLGPPHVAGRGRQMRRRGRLPARHGSPL